MKIDASSRFQDRLLASRFSCWVANGIRTRTKRSTISRANPYTIATIDLRGPLTDFLECCKGKMRSLVGAEPGLGI